LIYALLMRRLWLWQNRLIPSILLIMALPLAVYLLISLSFKNIILQSLSGLPYEIWVIPGIIFIVSSLGLYPLLYRDFFHLRIHKKVLPNVALAPFRKRTLISGYLVVAGIESLIFGLVALLVMAGVVPSPFSFVEQLLMFLCLIAYLFILGNFYITLGLIIDTVTTLFLITIITFLFIIFGNGFVIEFGFFPMSLESLLSWQPFAIPFRIFQSFLGNGLVDWTLYFGIIIFGVGWTFFNTTLLKRRMLH